MCMHFCNHDFAKWALDTAHMTRIEKSIYLDMRTLVLTEKGLTSDLEMLYRHLNVKTDEEIQAVTFLLRDKFKLDKRSNTYKHKDWEQELKNYKHSKRKKETKKDGTRDGQGDGKETVQGDSEETDKEKARKAKYRNKVNAIKSFLRSKDVDIKGITSVPTLRKLAEDNGYIEDEETEKTNAKDEQGDGTETAEDGANSSHNKEFNNSEFSNLDNKKNKTKKSDQANVLVNFWNERANQSVKLETWETKINARLKTFSVTEIEKAMLFVINHWWYQEKGEVLIKNVVSSNTKLETLIAKANQPLQPQTTGNQNYANNQPINNPSYSQPQQPKKSSADEYAENLARQLAEQYPNEFGNQQIRDCEHV